MGTSVTHMDSTEYAAAVAANVKAAIDQANRSVLSVSRQAGIPQTTLDHRLKSNGFSPFSVAELKAIADVLGRSASDLTTVYVATTASERIPA